jgi:hypothetical protein
MILAVTVICAAGIAAAAFFLVNAARPRTERWRPEVKGLLAVPSPCCRDATLWDSIDDVSEDGERPRPATAAEAALWINTWPYLPRGEEVDPGEPALEVGIKNSEVRCTGTPSGPDVPQTGNDAYTLENVRLRPECVYTKWRVWAPQTAEWRRNERHTVWAEEDGFFYGRVDYWR